MYKLIYGISRCISLYRSTVESSVAGSRTKHNMKTYGRVRRCAVAALCIIAIGTFNCSDEQTGGRPILPWIILTS